jgi:NAD(P)H-hydrate epimerase
VDIPSGLDADTGQPHGAAVRADLTVTMGLAKPGLVGSPGFEYAGEIVVADIGIPRRVTERARLATFLLEAHEVAPLVPARPASGHKGTFGHLLVIAGSRGKAGAALLCGEAALRAGAGLVTIAAPPDVQPALERRVRELMVVSYASEADLARLCERKRAVAVGPGIPTDDTTQALVRRLCERLPLPMVVDADGLRPFAAALDRLRRARGPRLLTPHPAEMARLLGTSSGEVQADRLATARRAARTSGAAVALKGARTVVAVPDGQAWINPTGGPALATGGTGDVLTGVCGALLAQGAAPEEALRAAVYVHGRAADLAARKAGTARGLIARDVISHLGAALTF